MYIPFPKGRRSHFFTLGQLLALLTLLTLSLPALAQSKQARIRIRDQQTLQPVATAAVILTSGTKSTTIIANQSGECSVPLDNSWTSLTIESTDHYPSTIARFRITRDTTLYLRVARISQKTVVVSAGRFEEKYSDVSQQVEVLSEADLQFMSQSNMADVMQQSGQVLVQKSQQGGGSPIIRGFEANRVLMVVDGVRMNNAIYRSGHLQNIITMDNSVLSRVETVFGPGAVMYGSDALGGVMHFFTKKPELADSGSTTNLFKSSGFVRTNTASWSSANTGIGRLGEKTANAMLKYGGKKWASLTAFTISDFGDLRQGAQRSPYTPDIWKRNVFAARVNGIDSAVANSDPNLQIGGAYSQMDILQKVLFQPNKNTSHTLNLQYSTSSNINRYDRLSELRNGQLRFAEWYYGPQTRLLTAYHGRYKLDKAFADQVLVNIAYQRVGESRHDRAFKNPIRENRTESLNAYTATLDAEKQVAKGHELRYGIDAWLNTVNSTSFGENVETGARSNISTRYPDGGNVMWTAAAYANHSWEINEKWQINDGLRYTMVGLRSKFTSLSPYNVVPEITQNTNALNGNLGLIYKPTKQWKISLLKSTGFRAPNVDEVGKVFDSQAGDFVVVPNGDLQPEYVWNTELNISRIWDNGSRLQMVGYYMAFNDIMLLRPFTVGGRDSLVYAGQLSQVVANQNAENAYVFGGSIVAEGQLSESFLITSSVSYNYGRVRGINGAPDVPLDHIPPIYGKVGLTYQAPKLRLELFSLFNGWKYIKDYSLSGEDNLNYATPLGMPAWWTLNARGSYSFSRLLSMQLAIENALDRNYRVFASGISAPGRMVSATIRVNF